MRLTRVFVDQPLAPGVEAALGGEVAAHLVRVLRLQVGDPCVLFNGDGRDADAVLVECGKRGAVARVRAVRDVDVESPLHITLLQGVARGEKMDLILQKATELGVAGFVPVFSERSEVRLEGERADKRLAHWQGVVHSACGQSGRARVPAVAPPRPLAEALQALPDGPRLMLDPAAPLAMRDALPPAAPGCVLAIGPEGGWSSRDAMQLAGAGFSGVRLGPRVLRTETAGLAAIAALQAVHGDLR